LNAEIAKPENNLVAALVDPSKPVADPKAVANAFRAQMKALRMK